MKNPEDSNQNMLFIAMAMGAMASAVAIVFFLGLIPLNSEGTVSGSSSSPVVVETKASPDSPPGAVIVEVPWKHLPHIGRFQMTNQDGDAFDSASLAGHPYVVSFFFAGCPSICRELNNEISRRNDQLKREDLAFVSISVDPENDTPEVLKRYSQDYEATTERWSFLTAQQYKIDQVGEQMFGIVVDKEHHTDNILLVDKWGRYRDRFKWDDPYDMQRFVDVAKQVCAELRPPIDEMVRTRNAMAGFEPADLSTVSFLREFHLTNNQGQHFFSRDLTGKVWIGNFFFTSCPGICKEQTKYLTGLQSRLENHPTKIISITTDPVVDSPAVLDEYARKADADPERWTFLTGQTKLIPRIGSEYFRAMSDEDHHSSLLYIVDRWCNVRGQFDWREPQQEAAMLKLVDELWAEKVPPAKFEYIQADAK
jgi:cytochrome oxidase Cu insertion factor (SCO1/SenC/PrrC family)